MNFQFLLKPIFALLWRKRFRDGEYKLIKVTGWRSCIMDSRGGQRIRGTFLFTPYKELNCYAGFFVRENNTSTINARDKNDTSTI